jgi:dienelactone hydrolase
LSTLLTPISLWKDFQADLPLGTEVLDKKAIGDYTFEYVTFWGRQTDEGRVKIYGIFAYKEGNAALTAECVYVLPDSKRTVDEDIMMMYLKNGYSVFMVDYRGEFKNCEHFTQYPADIPYANTALSSGFKNRCEETAKQTCWYEWVAVARYGCAFLEERLGPNVKIGLVGLRDGGEIAWKLATLYPFACAVTVCAVGWKAYRGIPKYGKEELVMNDERYRFIAGIDSQSYAPFVRCPVLILCSTNDPRFDYDRAYDTFMRINPDYLEDSNFAFSVMCNSYIGANSSHDMFMFLDKMVKGRQVFIPTSSNVSIFTDEEQNLVADVSYDERGSVEKVELYVAEDCLDSFLREWTFGMFKEKNEHNYRFLLNVYEHTTKVFALCYVKYTNGFTAWSKICVKDIHGRFRNTQNKCHVLYAAQEGVDGFSVSTDDSYAIGGVFLKTNDVLPQLVNKSHIMGIYSVCGLTTFRIACPRYAPNKNSLLQLDVYCDETTDLELSMFEVETGKTYITRSPVVGGVWQSIKLESKLFKNEQNVSLGDYMRLLKFGISCKCPYAINNVIWL